MKIVQGYRLNGKEIGESIRTGRRLRSLWLRSTRTGCYVKRWTLVVVQQTFLPDFPGFCILQLGYVSVEIRPVIGVPNL